MENLHSVEEGILVEIVEIYENILIDLHCSRNGNGRKKNLRKQDERDLLVINCLGSL